ncbi:MAG: ATP-grasp domain-containing protein [Anaerolineae bacterium]|nr:ATP-grasp domain-containing protein [Anaerolineae bacterium]
MFSKIVIANRGEIAVRIIRACREMGIAAVALYEPADRSSLHVRLADECVPLTSPADFFDQNRLIAIAHEMGAQAIHPGYGFLAENIEFVQACAAANLTFIGPPAFVLTGLRNKIGALQTARAAGYPTVTHSPRSFAEDEYPALEQAAQELGYPLVIKSCHGGRGAGERLVHQPHKLAETVRRAQAEAQAVFGNKQLYLEKAILPAHQINVQIMGDRDGRLIHLGEREGSLQLGSRKLLEESPAPCLNEEQRQKLWQTALQLGRLFGYQNLGSVEFLVDGAGEFYFTEFKARLQVEHPITEVRTGVDLVREQIRLAAGGPLAWSQADIHFSGHAMLCRLNAEDPWNHYLPAPGHLQRVRWPGGYGVRVDSYVQCQSDIPPSYDPLIAKLTTWGADRQICAVRMRCALEDCKLMGTPTNLPLLQRILHAPAFLEGRYDTEFLYHPFTDDAQANGYYRDLAVIAAVLYQQKSQMFQPVDSPRQASGWHRESRRLPQ